MSKDHEYKWVPGAEIPLDAIQRMRNSFRKPPVALEEMRNSIERDSYTELMDKPIEEVDAGYLDEVLSEISSCTFSFGHREDWQQWFKYMLPALILRCKEGPNFDFLSGSVVTAFMSIYWEGIPDEYVGFRDDVIDSLSLCLMNKELWFDHFDRKTGIMVQRSRFLDSYPNGQDRLILSWDSIRADESLSSMMFFCLKYLTVDEIRSWVGSLFSIDDINWNGALMVWLLGALDLLKKSPIFPRSLEKSSPNLEWENSHVFNHSLDSSEAEELKPTLFFNSKQDFLPSENTRLFFQEVRKYLTDELIVEWAVLFGSDSLVMESTYTVPESLIEKLSKN